MFSRRCVGHCLQLCSTTSICPSYAYLVCRIFARLLDLLHACVASLLAGFLPAEVALWGLAVLPVVNQQKLSSRTVSDVYCIHVYNIIISSGCLDTPCEEVAVRVCRNDFCCRRAISSDVLFPCFSIQAGTLSLNQITGLFSRLCVGHCLRLRSTTWTCWSHACLVCWSFARLLDLQVGEIGDQLAQKCTVGDVVAIQGGSFVAIPAQYSTSRLHYHLRLKGPLGLQVRVQKLPQAPWEGLPAVHPLVPLQALSWVKDRQQICVAVSVVENPGAVERHPKHSPAMVCNAIVAAGRNPRQVPFLAWASTGIGGAAGWHLSHALSGSDQQMQGWELMGNRQLAWDDHSAVFAGNGRSAVLEPQSMRVVWTVDFSF